MKNKILSILFLFTLVTCITGCNTSNNDKKLTCVQNGDETGLKINIEMEFKKNTLDTMNINELYDSSKLKVTEDTIKKFIESNYACNELGVYEDSYKSALLNCNAELKNGNLSIDTSYDVNKIEDSVIKSNKSYSNVKEYFEMQGLICK